MGASRPGILNDDRVSPESHAVWVRNDTSTALAAGAPICYTMDGTRNGLDVIDANTGAAAKATTLFAGVPTTAIDASGGKGYSQVFGYISEVRLLQRTRAASTDSFVSVAALALGAGLQIDTVNDAFLLGNAGAQSDYLAFVVACESQAAIVSTVSTAANALTAETTSIKAFLRAM